MWPPMSVVLGYMLIWKNAGLLQAMLRNLELMMLQYGSET